MGNQFNKEYKEGRVLGKGAQGEVIQCRHKISKQDFAVKFIELEKIRESPDDLERFE